jgi:proline iminopeptidase
MLYPETQPYASGHVPVSEQPEHRIWYALYGNPDGEPAVFVHGGPGIAAGAEAARFFDPRRFRILVYHQRGTGKSLPFLSLADNTTRHLVADIARLRDALGIDGLLHVFGGSWGSFLALMYALEHPETVASLVLRGIFLGRKIDLYEAYQKDAYAPENRYSGPARIFPNAWRRFVAAIPPEERGGMLEAYARRIHGPEPGRTAAAREWYAWEDAILRLKPASDEDTRQALQKTEDVISQAVMETHYFRNTCFLSDYGGDDYILENAGRIAHIPTTVVQGIYDQCTPRYMADELVAALNTAKAQAGLAPVDYRLTIAGHTMMDDANQGALVDATRGLQPPEGKA